MKHELFLAHPLVMRGLDPRIHPLLKKILFERLITVRLGEPR
jgi:hypothetical protein